MDRASRRVTLRVSAGCLRASRPLLYPSAMTTQPLEYERLKALYQRCDPGEPLEPGDLRNCDIDAAASVRGGRWLNTLVLDLLWARKDDDGNIKRVLFSGLVGSGKSTELRRLAETLRGERRVVVLVSADRFLDLLKPLHFADVFLALLYEVEREVKARVDPSETWETFEETWRWLCSVDPERAPDHLGEQARGVPAEVIAEFKRNSPLRRYARAIVDENPTAFLARIRGAFRALERRAIAEKHDGVVVIVDSLEHLRGVNPEQHREVMDAALTLFSGTELNLPVPTLYTVPPSVLLRMGRLDEHFFPMVKLSTAFDRDAPMHKPGYDALREFITRRIPEPELAALFGDDLVEARVNDIIRSSGGYPRNIVRMLEAMVRHARPGVVPAVDQGTFVKVLTDLQQPMVLTLRFEGPKAFEILRDVCRTHKLAPIGEEQQALAARLLDMNMVLFYKNSVWWWDLHPWIASMEELV